MRQLFVPTAGPCDWQRLLADPQRHWRQGKTAYELAVAGFEAQRWGFRTRGTPRTVFCAGSAQFRGLRCFAEQLGMEARGNAVASAGIQLWVGWVMSSPVDDEVIRDAVS
jgi:hypothetical protein